MLFALCSSTISTIAFEIFMNKKPTLTHIFSGSISGAILFGSVASFTTNIAAPIAVGLASGFFSALYNKILLKKVNKNQLHDSLGIFGPIFFTSILSTAVLSPIVIKSFSEYSLNTPPLEGSVISSSGQSAWMLIYCGISSGMGLLTGMIISTIMRCLSHQQ
jgi:ammonia channel protein AmtB